jgi:HEAT repeat protein
MLLEVFLHPGHQKILHEFQKGEMQRNLLIHELAETSKKFRGSTLRNILWMFEKMSLKEQLSKNLADRTWDIKANAIQQVAALQQKNSIKDLFPLTNDENELLRMEAQISIVKITGFEGLKFLNEITYPISEWQQLRLIEELSGHAPENLSSIFEWLKSKNESVINFALRLVEIYRQYNFYDQVLTLLSHSSILISRSALITLSHIINETTIDFLAKNYHDFHPELQIQILKIIQMHGNEEQIEFLISLLNDNDNSVNLEAAKAIYNINSTGIQKIKESVNHHSYPWTTILPQLKLQVS